MIGIFLDDKKLTVKEMHQIVNKYNDKHNRRLLLNEIMVLKFDNTYFVVDEASKEPKELPYYDVYELKDKEYHLTWQMLTYDQAQYINGIFLE